jgi:hypothetical protein
MSQCGTVIAIATAGPHRLHAPLSASSNASTAAVDGCGGRIGTTFGGYRPASISDRSRHFKQRLRLGFFPIRHLRPANDDACKAGSEVNHDVSVSHQIAARSPRAGVAAPFAPPSGAASSPTEQWTARSGAFHSTTANARRFLADARPCLPSISNLRRPFLLSRRQAVQTVSGLLILAHRRRRQTVRAGQIVVSARYPHPIDEVNANNPAHRLVSKSGEPLRPALVSAT